MMQFCDSSNQFRCARTISEMRQATTYPTSLKDTMSFNIALCGSKEAEGEKLVSGSKTGCVTLSLSLSRFPVESRLSCLWKRCVRHAFQVMCLKKMKSPSMGPFSCLKNFLCPVYVSCVYDLVSAYVHASDKACVVMIFASTSEAMSCDVLSSALLDLKLPSMA
jgi:hypothetical protein